MMKFKAFLSGVAIISTILFGVVYSEQGVVAESVVSDEASYPTGMETPIPVDPTDTRGEPVEDLPSDVDEYTIKIIIDNTLVDTLTFKYGDTLSLTNHYKGLTVKGWTYGVTYRHPDGRLFTQVRSVCDEDLVIKVTRDNIIAGYTVVFEPCIVTNEPASTSNAGGDKDTVATSKPTAIAQKKLSSPSILKYKRGMKKLTIKGKKGSVIVVKVGIKSKTVYMKNKIKKVLVLDKALKKGTKIKIYAKKAGYQKSKTRIYKVI